MPNGTDISSLVADYTSDADRVYVGTVQQESGVSSNDFRAKVNYDLWKDNKHHTVEVYVFDLPVVFINTPGGQTITSRTDWISGADISIFKEDGTPAELTSAATQIRGRGNSTWGAPKKPYTIKLESKSKVLDMPKSKRWNLLANHYDPSMIKNDLALELGRRSDGMDWNPDGKFVELILNGRHMGDYYLCEHIKIESKRVNIKEQHEGDVDLTGGYLIEMDLNYDELNKFRTAYLNLPVMLKSPDWSGYDMSYITDYIETLESKLVSGSIQATDYKDSLDIESFIDFWLVQELVSNFEPQHPKSVYLYKDCYSADDNKLHAGPLWDFDFANFTSTGTWFVKDHLWYGYLFQDPDFVAAVKSSWNSQKTKYRDMIDNYIDVVAARVSNSVYRDKHYWTPSDTVPFQKRITSLKNGLNGRYSWMDTQINSW